MRSLGGDHSLPALAQLLRQRFTLQPRLRVMGQVLQRIECQALGRLSCCGLRPDASSWSGQGSLGLRRAVRCDRFSSLKGQVTMDSLDAQRPWGLWLRGQRADFALRPLALKAVWAPAPQAAHQGAAVESRPFILVAHKLSVFANALQPQLNGSQPAPQEMNPWFIGPLGFSPGQLPLMVCNQPSA